ncbi:MAG: PEGA domain-containing protein, partial [Patescibacteria group bacterium]
MIKLFRCTIISFLFLGFLLLSPYCIFYAKGYRFDLQEKNFQKTGILDIKSNPSGGKIYLNSKLIKKFTPYKIENLLPKKYMLKIEKASYKTWQNEIEIFSEKITSIDHIILLPENSLSKIFIKDNNLSDFLMSWNEKRIAYQIDAGSRQGLWVLDLASEKTIQIFKKFGFERWQWSSDNKRIFLQKNDKAFVLFLDNTDFNNEKPQIHIQDISLFLGKPVEQIEWDPRDKDRLFFLQNNTIFLLNLTSFYRYELLKNVKTFYIHNQIIHCITKQGKNAKLVKLKLYQLDKIEEENAQIISGDNYKLFIKDKNKIAYLADNNLYLIQEGLSVLLNKNIQNAQWSKDLLYYNDYEIWVYFMKNKKNELLTRVSQKLENIAWWPYSKYIIFSQDKEIKFLECAEDLQRWHSYTFYNFQK